MKLELLYRFPEATPKATPILFIHGAWHAAWCWENFLPWFAERGYAAYALSLRGHGTSAGAPALRWYSAADYVADVEWAVSQLPAQPVIVGHSMGGYVTQKFLERHEVPGAVLLASIPVHGIYQFAVRMAARHPGPFLRAHFLLDARQMVGTPALVRDAFFSAVTPEEIVTASHRQLTGESFRLEVDALFANLPNPKRVKSPVLVLAARGDTVFSVGEQQKTARAYGTQAEIFDMAHDMMLEPGWEQVAEGILRWLPELSIRISQQNPDFALPLAGPNWRLDAIDQDISKTADKE